MAKSKRPYLLPVTLTCDAAEIENGVSMELVDKYIGKHSDMLRRYDYLENLYRGFHDVYKEPEKESWKPDNRLAVNFPRYITDTFIGYAYGIPIKVGHPDDKVAESISDFEHDNEISDHDAELVKKCCIYGHTFEYAYQEDGTTRTRLTSFTPKELFVVYDDTVKSRALFAVRYGRHGVDSANSGKLYGEILTPERIEHFDAGAKTNEFPNPYGLIPVVELNEIFRQSMQSLIVTSAHRIINGEMPDIRARDSDFFFMRDYNMESIAHTIGDLCARRLKNAFGYDLHEHIQVLSPTRKGILGTYELNNRLQALVNPNPSRGVKVGYYTLNEGDKVMQSRNNYDIPWARDDGEMGEGVFNGDIGVMIEVNNASKLYKVRFDDRIAAYDSDSVGDLELAYACTVHKSQGNEFECVVMPMYRGAPQLMYRNLLYTAVTRAKKLLILVGDEKALQYMVENNRRILRYTGLKTFLIRS